MSNLPDEKHCRCACHSHNLAKESGFIHDALCCDQLNGSLEMRAIQAHQTTLLKEIEAKVMGAIPEYQLTNVGLVVDPHDLSKGPIGNVPIENEYNKAITETTHTLQQLFKEMEK